MTLNSKILKVLHKLKIHLWLQFTSTPVYIYDCSLHLHLFTSMPVYIYIFLHLWLFTYKRIYIHDCLHLYLFTSIIAYIYIIIWLFTYITVYIYGCSHLWQAAYLQKSGLDVCVLERRHIIGGAAVTEEIVPGNNIECR